MQLNWQPQPAYADFFYTDPQEILNRRTVFRDELDYWVMYGGRGSAKTWTAVDAVVIEASLRPVRVLVTRELQTSIEESIKAEIEAAIDTRNLNHFFDVKLNTINGINGSRFIFKGLKNNIKNLKSIADVDIVLCEESEGITKLSWDKLLPSIRPRDKIHREGSPIVIVIFNPDNELDDTYQRWVINPPEDCLTRLINYTDNKYFPAHLEKQRLHFKKTRPLRDYEHEWLGKPTGSGGAAIVDLEWVKAARFASKAKGFQQTGDKRVGYDPSGQGKDSNATVFMDGNILKEVDEWVKSPDLRLATNRAFSTAIRHKVNQFRFDECGGLGDGVEVFVSDTKMDKSDWAVYQIAKTIIVDPFNAGDSVVNEDEKIPGTDKTFGEEYTNAKAQAHGITAQLLYNTYRFIILGETDMKASEIVSIDIEDDELFNKLARELSTPLWIKSAVNSKKKVEDKKAMEKRTGQPSPNISDAWVMLNCPVEKKLAAMAF